MQIKTLLAFFFIVLLVEVSRSESTIINLINRLAPSQGYKVSTGNVGDGVGSFVQGIGDIDKDGIQDFAVADMKEDAVYVIYGRANTTAGDINLLNLTPDLGFKITGISGSWLGNTISTAGDVNQDGVDDFMVAAVLQNYTETVHWSGAVYIIYGQNGSRDIDIDLTEGLDPSRGYAIISNLVWSDLGSSLTALGDINNDGYDDIAIGCEYQGGSFYVVYGQQVSHNFTIENITSGQGFQIKSPDGNAALGYSIASGDFNNDTIIDILVGAPSQDAGSEKSGVVYVIYGNKNGIVDIDLGNLTPEQGFRILGSYYGGGLGIAVAFAGDLNHDGIGDMAIGTDIIEINSNTFSGAYIIYGQNGTTSVDIDVSADLNPSQGFVVISADNYLLLGISVSPAGDLNHDGVDDVLIGAVDASYGPSAFTGAAIVVYGKQGGNISRINLDGEFNITQGFVIVGDECSALGISVSSGDFDGDGIVDLLLGAEGYFGLACTPPGAAYVLHFGNI